MTSPNKAKTLKKSDECGDLFSDFLFASDIYEHQIVDFDRIHYDYKNQQWVIIDHILCSEKINDFSQLDEKNQSRIDKLIKFGEFFNKKSSKSLQIIIDLYYPKEHPDAGTIQILQTNKTFHSIPLSDFAAIFKESNFYAAPSNVEKDYENDIYQPISSEKMNQLRQDNSAFSLSRAILGKEVTFGFNLDKLIFDPKKEQAYVYEFLLCDPSQAVNPHTSHPNKYFHKNAMKFINLYRFSQLMNAPLYLINYAPVNSQHQDKARLMKLAGIDSKKPNPITTINKEITPVEIRDLLLKIHSPKEEASLQIGFNFKKH